jgi:hypothetical protein
MANHKKYLRWTTAGGLHLFVAGTGVMFIQTDPKTWKWKVKPTTKEPFASMDPMTLIRGDIKGKKIIYFLK